MNSYISYKWIKNDLTYFSNMEATKLVNISNWAVICNAYISLMLVVWESAS